MAGPAAPHAPQAGLHVAGRARREDTGDLPPARADLRRHQVFSAPEDEQVRQDRLEQLGLCHERLGGVRVGRLPRGPRPEDQVPARSRVRLLQEPPERLRHRSRREQKQHHPDSYLVQRRSALVYQIQVLRRQEDGLARDAADHVALPQEHRAGDTREEPTHLDHHHGQVPGDIQAPDLQVHHRLQHEGQGGDGEASKDALRGLLHAQRQGRRVLPEPCPRRAPELPRLQDHDVRRHGPAL
mmetsp:Transcript_12911/g.29312  ORF Transcript_12911/g.29312 Transcript_12911/m.29312 type:complete len:241 (-) Transcript_12911:384-1106(-)